MIYEIISEQDAWVSALGPNHGATPLTPRFWDFVAIPWVQLYLTPFLLERKEDLGMADPQSGRFYLNLYCWAVVFSKPGESIHWETCSFSLCNDTLLLYLTIPLNSSSKVNTSLGCTIGSPQTLFPFRFPCHSVESLVRQPGNLYSQIP